VYRWHLDDFETAEEIADAVTFWKAHLVPPKRAAFPSNPAYVEAYRRFEELRLDADTLRVSFEDMVYTAVGVLGRSPRLLGRIDHVLVDEFQDVNPGRVELLRRLIHPGTTLMAVGDEDQGINEWCGAHPRFFRDFAETFPDRPTRVYPLSRSFRFGAGLAEAANRVIRHNEDRLGGAVVGGGPTEGAAVTCADPGETVKALIARGVRPQDVAVLYRGRTQAAAVLAALAIDGVPMRTDDIGLLRRGRGPDLAVAYLREATSEAPARFEDAWPIVFAPDRYIQKEAFSRQLASRRPLRSILRDREGALRAGQNRKAVASMVDLAHLLDRMGRCATAGRALDVLLEEVDVEDQLDRKSTRLNSSHNPASRMPSSA
jgi:DNA helicase-2/ATP-dependent DNA helicase PcrA